MSGDKVTHTAEIDAGLPDRLNALADYALHLAAQAVRSQGQDRAENYDSILRSLGLGIKAVSQDLRTIARSVTSPGQGHAPESEAGT